MDPRWAPITDRIWRARKLVLQSMTEIEHGLDDDGMATGDSVDVANVFDMLSDANSVLYNLSSDLTAAGFGARDVLDYGEQGTGPCAAIDQYGRLHLVPTTRFDIATQTSVPVPIPDGMVRLVPKPETPDKNK